VRQRADLPHRRVGPFPTTGVDMNQDELNQKIERIGIRIFNVLKDEGITLDAEDLDELENKVLNWIAKYEELK
jgi:DNA polymerase I-like protein with 3'-5' exonuclease and polymerase domains